MLDGRAEDGQRGVALELVDEAAVPGDGVDHHPEELVEQADHLGGRPCRRQLGGADQVDEQHGDVALLAAQLGAALQRPAGHVLADVAAEQVTQPLPLGQVAHHVVEAGLQQAQLAGVVDLHVRVVVAALHLAERPAQLAQRVGDRHGHQHACPPSPMPSAASASNRIGCEQLLRRGVEQRNLARPPPPARSPAAARRWTAPRSAPGAG